MPSVLESSDILRQIHRTSVEDYHAFGDAGFLNEDVELLRGVIICKMPKSPLHEYVAHVLRDLIASHIPSGFAVRHEAPLTIGNSEPEPDISVVKGKPLDWLTCHPNTATLVIEIAVSSVSIDEEKAHIYAEAGIPEYWLIRPEARELDLFRGPTVDGYASRTILRDGDTIRAIALPEIEFAVSEIFPPKA